MYPVFGNWVWGGGWLSQLGVNFGLGHGHLDFAGSSVVHMQGGVIALIFAWLIGPRHGKYDAAGKLRRPIMPHNIPMVMLGTFILAFGWFGFNPGSTLAGTDLRIAVVAVNTMIAGSTATMATTLYMWWFKTKKPDPSMMCNGMLAGLVAITAPCAFVSAGGASIIGLISASSWSRQSSSSTSTASTTRSARFPCMASTARGAVSRSDRSPTILMATAPTESRATSPAFYGGGMTQFWAELIGVVTCFVTLTILSLIVYKIIEVMVGNSVSLEVEIEGLDLPEMGVAGYAGMVMDKQSETPVAK
jgi:Amt family ammonium transporter